MLDRHGFKCLTDQVSNCLTFELLNCLNCMIICHIIRPASYSKFKLLYKPYSNSSVENVVPNRKSAEEIYLLLKCREKRVIFVRQIDLRILGT